MSVNDTGGWRMRKSQWCPPSHYDAILTVLGELTGKVTASGKLRFSGWKFATNLSFWPVEWTFLSVATPSTVWNVRSATLNATRTRFGDLDETPPMQANPYATSRLSTDDSQAPPLRPVIRYWLLSVLSMGIGSLFAIPAFILLTNGQIGIFDISVNGHPVTNKSAIAWSLGISIPLFVLWIGSAIIAMRNMRRNLFKT